MKKRSIYSSAFLLLMILVLPLSFQACFFNQKVVTSIDYEPFVDSLVQKYTASGEVKANPLIVINGVPKKYDVWLQEGVLKTYDDTIKAHMSLQEETARAMYGTRAQHGVIMLTTKRYLALINSNSR